MAKMTEENKVVPVTGVQRAMPLNKVPYVDLLNVSGTAFTVYLELGRSAPDGDLVADHGFAMSRDTAHALVRAFVTVLGGKVELPEPKGPAN